MKFDTQLFNDMQVLINQSQNITVITHSNPDGDAIGSSFAWAGILKQLGKNVTVILPNDCPENLHWIEGYKDAIIFDKQKQNAILLLQKTDLFCCLDFNNLSRIDELGEIVKTISKPWILIDHHPYPENFADILISRVDASSTSELVYHVIQGCGYKELITKSIAEALYTGIITDTGGLSHNSSNSAVYLVVADLLSYNVDKTQIHDELFNVFSYNRMLLLGTVLKDNFVYIPEYKAAYSFISLENQRKYDFQLGDSEGFVNFPLAIKDVTFCALFTEYENKTIKVSFRSKRSFPANAFSAEFFNGGGHLNASGGRRNTNLQDAISIFVKGLEKYKDLLLKM